MNILIQIDTLLPERKEDTKKIKSYLTSVSVNLEYTLYLITNLITDIYKNDVNKWRKALDSSYNVFAKKIDSVDNSVFDAQKLEKFVFEPYKDPEKLAEIYKLNLKKEAYKFKSTFNDNAARYYLALKDFSEVLAEFQTNNPNLDYIYYKINLIFSITGQKTIENNAK